MVELMAALRAYDECMNSHLFQKDAGVCFVRKC